MKSIFFIFCLYLSYIEAKCPIGFTQSNLPSMCYKYYASPSSFYDAQAKCASTENGYLATSNDGFTNAFLGTLASDSVYSSYQNVWLGGYKAGGNWQWLDGEVMAYTNWAGGQPSSGNCIEIQPTNYQWVAENCSALNPFLCEAGAIPDGCNSTCPICPTAQPYRCPVGYNYFGGYCYKIVVGATFEVVRQQCLNDHGDLASVHSNYENDFLVALVDSTYPNNDIFIGLEYNGNNWYWSDGTQVDYTNWGSNQPNDESSYPCTILRGLTVTCNGNQGLWQNQDCTTTDSECANRVGGVCKFAATY